MRGEDGIDRRHDETPSSDLMEKSLPLQQVKRLEDRLTRNRQTLGEFVLNQSLSGFQPPSTNVVENRGICALEESRLDSETFHGLPNTVYEKSKQAKMLMKSDWMKSDWMKSDWMKFDFEKYRGLL
jgi:hypothetical protein